MLFAAGFGKRMQPLTFEVPKPLVKVAGKALLDHALEIANTATSGSMFANAHYLSDQIERHLEGSSAQVLKEPELLDTGGGLKSATGLSDPTLTLNTDAIWLGDNPLTQLRENWAEDDECLLLLVKPVLIVGL